MKGYNSLQTIYKSERVTVSRAIRDQDGKKVILKSQTSEFPSQRELTRIKYEYELSQKFSLDGMVPILGLEKQGNGFTLVIEDVGGIPLLEYWNSSSKTLSLFLEISISITKILSNLHENGIVHKDIKPANILVSQTTNQVYLIDLGLASLLSSEEQAPVQPDTLEGTLSYISPEQTGRMNRSIDFRTDLYSLGITFYEILMGRLPFTGKDAVEWVHAHIATSPLPPNEIQKDIPPALSNLILKLLSKNAEDRYHSTKGLLDDLYLALELLQENKPIEFIPGERESKSIFTIPQKLYGREAEVSFLLEAFDHISESPFKKYNSELEDPFGGVKLVLIGGYSGVGKTSLIQEIHKPILQKRGYFLSGKFDQFKRNIPYYSIIQAFTDLIRQILTEKDENILVWKEKIYNACNPNTSLLTELIPELQLIIGNPSITSKFTAQEEEDRFINTLLRFVGVFASMDHPLTIFVDDLQWADSPTLKFLETLTKSKEIHHLLLLVAYRDNEITPLHPMTQMIISLEKDGIRILKVTLTPLIEYFIERMISDTFHKEVGTELPELVYQKTGGNPFFVRHFLKTLYLDGCIYYSPSLGWDYDLEKIKNIQYTENVVELVANRIKNLSTPSINILKIASCIGANFSLVLLSLGFQKSLQETALSLKESLQEGILLPIDSSYRSIEILQIDNMNNIENSSYRFIHDRVQQAAYSLLSEEEKKKNHVLLGKTLLNSLSLEDLDSQIFEVVNHLNYGIDDEFSSEDRERLIQLNYRAGTRAGESFAFEESLIYFQNGISLLNNDSSQDLKFKLNYEYLNSIYKFGDAKKTINSIDDIFKYCSNKFQIALLYDLKVVCLTYLGEFEASIQISIEALRLFDIELKSNITGKDIFTFYKILTKKIINSSIDSLYELPEMQDKEIKIIMQILMNTSTAAYWKHPNYGTMFCFIMLEFSLKYGNSHATAFAYSIYGVFLSSIGDFNKSKEFAELSLKLNYKFPNNATALKIPLVLGFTIYNWIYHSSKSVELMMNAYNSFHTIKDITYCTSIIGNSFHISFILGRDFKNFTTLFSKYKKYIQNSYHKDGYYFCAFLNQFIQILEGEDVIWKDFNDQIILEKDYIASLNSSELKLGNHVFYSGRMFLNYLFKDYNSSYENFILTKQYRNYVIGMLNSAQDIFVSSLLLIKLNMIEPGKLESDTQKELQSYIKQYKNWSENNPKNFLHKYNLILAEFSKFKNEYWEASGYYEIAIESAIKNEYFLEAGLCGELCGKFYLGLNRTHQAKKYFLISAYYYDLCGAKALGNYIRSQYSEFLNTNSSLTDSFISRIESVSHTSKKTSIDIQSILKSTEVLTEEINLNNLLNKLMIIIIENAGAKRGILLLKENEDLKVEAEGIKENNQVRLFKGVSVRDFIEIPQSLIQYSARTQESVILEVANEDIMFKDNPYIQKEKALSILCSPIYSKGSIIGYVYLENNLIKGAFTRDRIEILNLILSHAAISIENARLYHSLEEKVINRTKEIEIQKKDLEYQKKSIEDLNIFIKKINESFDLEIILNNIHEYISKTFQIQHYSLGLVDFSGKIAQFVKTSFDADVDLRDAIHKIRVPIVDTIGAHAFAYKFNKPFYIKKLNLNRTTNEEKEIAILCKFKSFLILPLILNGKIIGFFDLSNQDTEMILNKEQLNQLSILTENLAGIIYSSNLYKELENQKKSIEELNIFVKKLNKSYDLNYILSEVHTYIQSKFNIEEYALCLVDSSNKYARFIESSVNLSSGIKEKIKNMKFLIVDVVSGHAYAFRANKPIYIRKLSSHRTTPEEQIIIKECNISSVLILPLVLEEKNIGYIDLFNCGTKLNLTNSQITQLSILAEQLSGIIHRTNLYVELQSQKNELELNKKFIENLNFLIKKLNESHSIDSIFYTIHEYIRLNYNIKHIGIGIVDSYGETARSIRISYPHEQELKEIIYSIKIPITGKVGAHTFAFNTNKPLLTRAGMTNRITLEEKEIVKMCKFKYILIIPLILKKQNIGFLNLFNESDEDLILTKKEISQLSILAEQLAGIIYSSNLYQEIQLQKKELEFTLTELRTTQDQLIEAEKSAALGQLISGVAHEINNPLAAIRSSAEILEMDQAKLLEDIPRFFQKNTSETLEIFIELQKKSENNKKYLPSREERLRKKQVYSFLETLPFENTNLKDSLIEYLTELYLEKYYSSLRSTFSEEEILQILKYVSLFSVQKNSLRNIQLSTEKSARVIFSLRKFLKTEIRGTPREISLSELIDKSLGVYNNYINGIITVKKEVNFNPTINLVVDEILQVFKNLLFNAIQSMYTSNEKVIQINSQEFIENSKSYLQVSIEDTGTGIPKDVVHKLFTPFFTTKSRGEGIGLGLFVSKTILEEHGGSLEYENLEIDSRFILRIPVSI